MKKIIDAEFRKNKSTGEYRATARPDGIEIMRCNCAGEFERVEFVPFSDALRRMDAGEWDDNLDLSFQIIKAWGTRRKDATDEELLYLWRWTLSTAFIREQREKNGTRRIEWQPGEFKDCAMYVGEYGGMNLYPLTERIAMANNIEGALIKRFGAEQGAKNAIRFYMEMAGKKGGLSEFGRDVLAGLHDGFIQQLNSEGLPSAPVAH